MRAVGKKKVKYSLHFDIQSQHKLPSWSVTTKNLCTNLALFH